MPHGICLLPHSYIKPFHGARTFPHPQIPDSHFNSHTFQPQSEARLSDRESILVQLQQKMRSPSKSVTNRVSDAESEMNLPPGFRFHPTDEELIFGGNFEGEAMFTGDVPRESLIKVENGSEQRNMGLVENLMQKEVVDDGNEWLDSLSLEDLHHCLEAMPPGHDFNDMPMNYNSNQKYFSN
ncbi:hypothetical protein L1987_82065 [Smallanthus sonchifolius]|uniref:Uncharacterized protein n=1 Tax=Smallanthus sonchifolius TaxID=185202 RepID=A0ACB8YTA4_9ASTR|nr:hypothetical protein L1987_82065 [Smallanthus sonchifolius]